ncbi:MAG TPA: hypothetical protein DCS05_09900 [Nitrospiraceae bacterium]|nr:hypothetical protein [Nitrospiraceae bacterium]
MSEKPATPRCPKCGGYLQPNKNIFDQVESIGCVNCGYRAFRGVNLRRPTPLERLVNTGITKQRRA